MTQLPRKDSLPGQHLFVRNNDEDDEENDDEDGGDSEDDNCGCDGSLVMMKMVLALELSLH